MDTMDTRVQWYKGVDLTDDEEEEEIDLSQKVTASFIKKVMTNELVCTHQLIQTEDVTILIKMMVDEEAGKKAAPKKAQLSSPVANGKRAPESLEEEGATKKVKLAAPEAPAVEAPAPQAEAPQATQAEALAGDAVMAPPSKEETPPVKATEEAAPETVETVSKKVKAGKYKLITLPDGDDCLLLAMALLEKEKTELMNAVFLRNLDELIMKLIACGQHERVPALAYLDNQWPFTWKQYRLATKQLITDEKKSFDVTTECVRDLAEYYNSLPMEEQMWIHELGETMHRKIMETGEYIYFEDSHRRRLPLHKVEF